MEWRAATTKLRPKRLPLLDCWQGVFAQIPDFLSCIIQLCIFAVEIFHQHLPSLILCLLQALQGRRHPFIPPLISRLVFGLLFLQHDSDQLHVNFRNLVCKFGAKALRLLYFLVSPDSVRRFVKMLNGHFVHLTSFLGFSDEIVV